MKKSTAVTDQTTIPKTTKSPPQDRTAKEHVEAPQSQARAADDQRPHPQ